MVHRDFWQKKVEHAWKTRSILWLYGVRRVGKTSLLQQLPESTYLDCELPSHRKRLQDPEAFLDDMKGKRIVLDEIHRLENPSELLKIAADHYPTVRIVATGSSLLGASRKFRDTLVGRKNDIWLTPMIEADRCAFNGSLSQRLLHGGLPPFFLAKEPQERDFQNWIDAYWSKDIQELFRLERFAAFQKFLELLLLQSGGIYEATRFTGPCEVSRETISNYLAVLEATTVAHVLRPFHSHRSSEIIHAPKVYGFDTGFVCALRGIHTLREEENGILWEHVVLNELQARLQTRAIHYWRDKRGHEIDFIVQRSNATPPIAIECKWTVQPGESGFGKNIAAFLRNYPMASVFIVSPRVSDSYSITLEKTRCSIVNLEGLLQAISTKRDTAS